MWMNRNVLKRLYPGVKWKRGMSTDTASVRYWGIYNGYPMIMAEEVSQEVDGRDLPFWAVSIGDINLRVVCRSLERALVLARPSWLAYVCAVGASSKSEVN